MRGVSLIPLQLALAPMRVLAIGELADVVPVKRPHDADSGEHRWPATGDDHQGLHRSLPLRGHVLGFRKFRDVVAGVLEGHQRSPVREVDRVVEGPLPANGIFATNRSHPRPSHASVRSNGLVRPDVCRPADVARRAAQLGNFKLAKFDA
jgi:hypothetical protein